MAKSTAVILVNYKKPGYTIACIRSLYEYCQEPQFDVIVVDNGSADGSVEIIKAYFPSVTYIEEKENLGFAEGNNQGLRISIHNGYQYSLILNNDTLVDEDLISKLKLYLDTNADVAAVQPAIYWMHQRDKLWNGPGFYNKWLGKTYNDNLYPSDGNVIEPAWVTGCCMMVRNNALVKSGLFNKRFFLYYEDADLSYRLKQKAGKLAYLPSAKVYHEAGVSGEADKKSTEGFLSPIIHYYISRNNFWFIRRYGLPILYPLNLACNLGYYFALWSYFKIKGKNNKASQLLRGVKEGLLTPSNQIWLNH